MHSIWTSNKKEDNNYNSADHHRQWYVKKKTTVSNRITSANGKFFSMMELGAREYTCHGLPLQTHSYLLPFYLFFFFESCINGVVIVFFWFLSAECVCLCETNTYKRAGRRRKKEPPQISLFPPPLKKKKFRHVFFFLRTHSRKEQLRLLAEY